MKTRSAQALTHGAASEVPDVDNHDPVEYPKSSELEFVPTISHVTMLSPGAAMSTAVS